MTPDSVGDEIEWASLMEIPRHVVNKDAIDQTKNQYIEGVSIRMLNDFVLSLWLEHIRSEKIIGYTFYFGYPFAPQRRDSAAKLDLIVAGSSFCEKQLKKAGIDRTKTIIQGINPLIFNPSNSSKNLLKDRFVVFSGGKFEYRKGNDIVIRAFQIFSDKHPDALLINS
jgi:glycosyltransferase involved in cell wall biosynthesis